MTQALTARNVKIIGGVALACVVMGWAALAVTDASKLAKLTAEARQVGLPTSDAELAALIGPEPSHEDELAFKDLDEVREWSGLADLERQVGDPPPMAKRLTVAESFLKSAEAASHIKSYRFTRVWKSFPTSPGRDLGMTLRAVTLFGNRAFAAADGGKIGPCLRDLETASRLVEVTGQDPSADGSRGIAVGRRRVCESLCTCLGVGTWTSSDLLRAKALLQSMDRDIDPRLHLAGQFAMHLWMCENADQVFQNMRAEGAQLNSGAWIWARMPGTPTKLKSMMIEAAVATQKLFADQRMTLLERLVKADAQASEPPFGMDETDPYYWFISARPAKWAVVTIEDRARRVASMAMVETLLARSKGDADWRPDKCIDPYTGKPVLFHRIGKGFEVTCDPSELNASLKSPDSKVVEIAFNWPLERVAPSPGLSVSPGVGMRRPTVN